MITNTQRSQLLEDAYKEIYGDGQYAFTARHSGRYKGYNASISRRGNAITIGMSRQWREISNDIVKGLMQTLLVRLFRKPAKTIEMELYQSFLKHVHIAVPKTKTEPALAESFTRLNDAFFNGTLEQPNLILGESIQKLGHYEYGTDTIMITKHLLQRPELLDYVMYHEMLHKKHKFTGSQSGRMHHHTKAFRDEEASYPDAETLETELSRFVGKLTRRRWFGLG